jgi:hypothetical protein
MDGANGEGCRRFPLLHGVRISPNKAIWVKKEKFSVAANFMTYSWFILPKLDPTDRAHPQPTPKRNAMPVPVCPSFRKRPQSGFAHPGPRKLCPFPPAHKIIWTAS